MDFRETFRRFNRKNLGEETEGSRSVNELI